jgi:hypothetical protein
MTDTFRKEYKQLSDLQKTSVLFIKEIAEGLEKQLDEISNSGLQIDKRRMALAKTNLEQAVMWAIKSIT